jgi:methyl-accepting chemotaxis protein
VLNPLMLPQAVLDGLAVLPALLRQAEEANRTLNDAIGRADRISAQADQLITQADQIQESFLRAHATLELMVERGDELLSTASDARTGLEGAQAELSRANDQVAKIIEMGGPLERGVDRLDRIVSRVRRDTQEGAGEGS